MNRLLYAVAAFALLAVPQFASAGPIPWSYSVTIDGVNGNSHLNLGTRQFVIDDGQTTSGPFDFYVTQVLPVAHNLPNNYVDSATGVPLVRITNQGGTDISQTPPTVATDDMFKVTMTLYGPNLEVVSFDFFGTMQLLAGNTLTDPMYLQIVGDGHAHTTLNGHHFDITVYSGNTETTTGLYADVVVTATPEPGTFALAGLGVIGLGLVRRIRRAW